MELTTWVIWAIAVADSVLALLNFQLLTEIRWNIIK